jgi:hypothetical protein
MWTDVGLQMGVVGVPINAVLGQFFLHPLINELSMNI